MAILQKFTQEWTNFVEMPQEYVNCKCHLTYNIITANIYLRLYKPIELNFRDKPLIFTPQLLLDHGLFNYAIVQDPNQIDAFERKLASAMLNLNRKIVHGGLIPIKSTHMGDSRKKYVMNFMLNILFLSRGLTPLENLMTWMV